MVARECFRKGGRRIIEIPYRTDDREINPDYNKRAKQFAAFDALRGFRDIIKSAEEDAKEMYDK